jgi:predicted metalloprotease
MLIGHRGHIDRNPQPKKGFEQGNFQACDTFNAN